MTIATFEEYNAVIKLLDMLYDLGLSTVGKTYSDFVCDHADEWTVCDRCGLFNVDCRCSHDENDYEGCRCDNDNGKCYC